MAKRSVVSANRGAGGRRPAGQFYAYRVGGKRFGKVSQPGSRGLVTSPSKAARSNG